MRSRGQGCEFLDGPHIAVQFVTPSSCLGAVAKFCHSGYLKLHPFPKLTRKEVPLTQHVVLWNENTPEQKTCLSYLVFYHTVAN